jgi:hypothetical protein
LILKLKQKTMWSLSTGTLRSTRNEGAGIWWEGKKKMKIRRNNFSESLGHTRML